MKNNNNEFRFGYDDIFNKEDIEKMKKRQLNKSEKPQTQPSVRRKRPETSPKEISKNISIEKESYNKHQDKITTQKDVFNLIKTLTGQANILTIPVAFIKYTRNIHTALFLSQLIYWTERTDDGWIYKTYNDWENEIYIKEYLIRKSKKILEEKDILETKVKKIHGNPTVHYRLKWQNFLDSFLCFLRNVNLKSKEPIFKIKETYNKTEITSEITLDINIYSVFLEKWNEQKIILHKKITSKRKNFIDKVLKLNDYSQEEIFKAFQNYATVLHSPDYFWNYTWSMEDFLQRGLNKFVDEVDPLNTYKNKSFQNNNQSNKTRSKSQQTNQYPSVNPTRESLNLFSYEKVDVFQKEFERLTTVWMKSGIWPENYIPSESSIFNALVKTKAWLNNIIEDSYGNVRWRLKTVTDVCKEYIDWIERQTWLDEEGREIQNTNILYPDNGLFKLFIGKLEGDIMDTPIRSCGWKNDEHLKIETPPEIQARKKRGEIEEKERRKQEVQDKETKKQNIIWIHSCMRKHLSDIDKTDIDLFDFSKWTDELNKKDFEDFVIGIEKKHQENPDNRNNGYIFLWGKR